jgi:hypothetical protein
LKFENANAQNLNWELKLLKTIRWG